MTIDLNSTGAIPTGVRNALGLPISVEVYGAAGDGVTDDTAAIQAALDAAEDDGGVVCLPVGVYVVTAPLVIAHEVSLRGAGRSVSTIKAGAGFSGASVVTMGNGSVAFGTRLVGLTIDCNNGAAAKGVTSAWLNEKSGLDEVTIIDFTTYGVDLSTGACQNFSLRGLELYGKSTANIVGIRLNGTGIGGIIEDVTVIPSGAVGVAAPSSSVGILLDGGGNGTSLRDIHIEGAVTGIELDAVTAAVVQNVTGSGGTGIVTDLVKVTNVAADSVVLMGLYPNGATNALTDLLHSVTLDTYQVGFYCWGVGGVGSDNIFCSDLRAANRLSKLAVQGMTTGTAAPAAGGAGALPATPLGYMTIEINGASRQIAYY